MRQTIKSNKASGPINFIDLIEDIRACTHCTKDLPLGPRPVLQANPKAKILIVGQWQDYLPSMVPLPHPSPRNTIWLRKNPWVEAEIIPALRTRVAQILAG